MGFSNGYFYANVPTPFNWFHLVVNFNSTVEGFKVYYDGVEVGSGDTWSGKSNRAANGRIVIGRSYTGRDVEYSSVEVDERLFFNEALSEEQIMMIKEKTF